MRPELLEAQAIASTNLNEVRRIARRLRPTVLEDPGLPYALLALAGATEGQTEVTLTRESWRPYRGSWRRPSWRSTGSLRRRAPMLFGTLRLPLSSSRSSRLMETGASC